MSKRCQRISCWGASIALFLLSSCKMDMTELCDDHTHATNVQVTLELELSSDISFDWISDWVYDWDEKDDSIWGGIGYTKPTSYQVRHYYIGKEPNLPHTDVEAFSTNDTCFNRAFTTGYHDLLIWSDIDAKDGGNRVGKDLAFSIGLIVEATLGMDDLMSRVISDMKPAILSASSAMDAADLLPVTDLEAAFGFSSPVFSRTITLLSAKKGSV